MSNNVTTPVNYPPVAFCDIVEGTFFWMCNPNKEPILFAIHKKWIKPNGKMPDKKVIDVFVSGMTKMVELPFETFLHRLHNGQIKTINE